MYILTIAVLLELFWILTFFQQVRVLICYICMLRNGVAIRLIAVCGVPEYSKVAWKVALKKKKA